MNLPKEYTDHIKTVIPDFDEYLSSLDLPSKRALRLNSDRMSKDVFLKIAPFEVEEIPFASDSFTFDFDGIGNHPLHLSGSLYVQEPSAMAPVSALREILPYPVLDVCSAPGGKSLEVYQRMDKSQVLVSNEFSRERIRALNQNIERCGVINSIITNLNGEEIDRFLPQIFGTVIVDAPCSGEGMMRKSAEAVLNWNLGNVEISSKRQKSILQSASKLLIPGGNIVYSTCTFSREEDEDVVGEFLSNNPDFSLVPPCNEVINNSLPGIHCGRYPEIDFSNCRRFYPHTSIGEGQFLAVLHKNGTPPELKFKAPKRKILKETEKAVNEFLSDTLNAVPDLTVSEEKDGIYLVPDFPELKFAPFASGVKLGVVQKGRIIPHHRFFMAFYRLFKRKIEIGNDPELIRKYLSGEEIPAEGEKGFAVVTYFGAPLGGGKISQNVLKNYLPKGIRL